MKKRSGWLISLTAAAAVTVGAAMAFNEQIKSAIGINSAFAASATTAQASTNLLNDSREAMNRIKEAKVLVDKIPGYWALWNLGKFKDAKKDLEVAKKKLAEAKGFIADFKRNITLIGGDLKDSLKDGLKDLEADAAHLETQIANAEANMAAATN